MKINTISGYVLVYLLSYGHWNIVVPVRAEGGGTGAGTKTGVDLNIKSDNKSTDKFGYEKVGEYVTYTAKDNNAFKLVKDDKVEVWKASDANSYSGRVELELLPNDGKAVTICLADNKTKLFKKDAKNDPWNEIDTTKLTRGSININYSQESYFYKHEIKGMISTFSPKTGFALNAANEYINGNKKEIWKASNDSDCANKIEVELMSNDSKAVTVFLPDDKTKIFIKTGRSDQWNEIDLSKVNPKTVNIAYDHDSYFYKNELKDKIRTFTAKKGFAFNGANAYVDGDKFELWKTGSEKEFANKIVMDGKKVTIYLKDGTTKDVAKGSDGKWPQQCLGPKTGIYLNLKATAGTQQFNYNKDGKVVTFTARGNKGFKSVESKGTVVWSTDNVSEYASKVVLDGKGKKEKKLTLYLPNNTTKVFKRDGKGKPWNDVSPQAKESAKTAGTTPAGGASQSGGGATK
ncbi:hypothetical protein MACK_000463 [Theileria orientalis]|uniref:Uncharacterized protein n=1 Tax=Theileria orientalis TaxID=68886 RepID=A0A976M9I5_THEOR|nr:hypothetical protein MACK_000463 [Theileria orientalis]